MSDQPEDPLWISVYLNEADAFVARRPRKPSRRNLEIFHAVRVLDESQRAVGERFQLSHTRIGQIVEQVETFYARTDGDRRGSRHERLAAEDVIHAERLNQLLQLSLKGYAESQHDQERVKIVVNKEGEKTREVQRIGRFHDPRFLDRALKVQQALHKFAVERAEREPPEADMPRDRRIAELRAFARGIGPDEDTEVAAVPTALDVGANEEGEMTKEIAEDEAALQVEAESLPEVLPPPPKVEVPPPVPPVVAPPGVMMTTNAAGVTTIRQPDGSYLKLAPDGRILFRVTVNPPSPPINSGHSFGPPRTKPTKPPPREPPGNPPRQEPRP